MVTLRSATWAPCSSLAPNHSPALNASSPQNQRPTVRIVIPPVVGIQVGGAAELAHGQNHGGVQQPAFLQVLQ